MQINTEMMMPELKRRKEISEGMLEYIDDHLKGFKASHGDINVISYSGPACTWDPLGYAYKTYVKSSLLTDEVVEDGIKISAERMIVSMTNAISGLVSAAALLTEKDEDIKPTGSVQVIWRSYPECFINEDSTQISLRWRISVHKYSRRVIDD